MISILSIFILKRNTAVAIFPYFHFIYIFVIVVLSQFIGSNKSFIVNLGIYIIYFSYYSFIKNRNNFDDYKCNKLTIILSWFSKLLKKYCFFICLIVALLFIYRGNYPKIRILNYNEASNYSFYIARFLIIEKNFFEQFNLNPVVGNFNAEVLIGEKGYYPHSFIFSILTHSGIIGTSLMYFYLLYVIIDYFYSLKKLNNNIILYDKLFIFTLVIWIFIMANISSFFTWYPVWFAFGFGFPFLQERKLSISFK